MGNWRRASVNISNFQENLKKLQVLAELGYQQLLVHTELTSLYLKKGWD